MLKASSCCSIACDVVTLWAADRVPGLLQVLPGNLEAARGPGDAIGELLQVLVDGLETTSGAVRFTMSQGVAVTDSTSVLSHLSSIGLRITALEVVTPSGVPRM